MFDSFWNNLVDWLWSLPLVIFILLTGSYFTFLSGLRPLKGITHAFSLLLGRYESRDAPGEVSHFHALCIALSGTIGMGNIAGVAIAISMGGPGAIFWMWVAGFVGMFIKFFTCTLACMYRQKDEDGIEQGGPMYFIEKGLGKKFKPLAILFAIAGLIGCIPMFQINQLAGLLENELAINKLITGLTAMTFIGIVIIGGIRRVGNVTARIVPFMFLLYVASSLIIILLHIEAIPDLLESIILSAFGLSAGVGGVTGYAFKEVLVTGIKRAIFSNEAGVGTEALAHGTAKTKEPIREGLVAMLGPFFDTHIVCTCTALVILISGIHTDGTGILITANAFAHSLPGIGNWIVYLVFILFAVSTILTYSYYSLKCARYLFGKRFGEKYLFVYLAIIPLCAIWTQGTIINMIDSMFAIMIFPTLLSTLLLSNKVVKEMRRYFDDLENKTNN